MIKTQELVAILKKNGFTDIEIETILNKKISTLLEQGQKQNIERILEILKKHRIGKEKIEKCSSVLARGKASEIEKILDVLEKNGIGKETVENCLSVLARGKASEIEKIKHSNKEEAEEIGE